MLLLKIIANANQLFDVLRVIYWNDARKAVKKIASMEAYQNVNGEQI